MKLTERERWLMQQAWDGGFEESGCTSFETWLDSTIKGKTREGVHFNGPAESVVTLLAAAKFGAPPVDTTQMMVEIRDLCMDVVTNVVELNLDVASMGKSSGMLP